ncbi:MAG: sigma 54-interacting transcriptional regulator [Bacillota bacterium]
MVIHNSKKDPRLIPFARHNNYGLWLTDGKGYTLGATSEYEEFSGIKAAPFIGSFMGDMERDGVLDRSVTLLVLKQKVPVTIPQTILLTKRKLIVTGNPIYNEYGDIILVATCVRPLDKRQENSHQPKLQQPVCIPGLGQVVASSRAMREVLARALQVASFDSTVLINGESGVGKEVVARVIHYLSPRKNGPFISVNVASIPEELFESELFGYCSGAFTGASKSGKRGLVKAAEGGTLFLDEISELPYRIQVKLLRLLQDREYIMVGDTVPRHANIRIIAASNQEISLMVQEGKFRKDLFYRLNVIPLSIPPLRERREDILALVFKFLQDFKQRYNIKRHFSSEALYALLNFDWPGNVRQLQNLLERLIIFSKENIISRELVEFELSRETEKRDFNNSLNLNTYEQPLKAAVEELEKKMLLNAIQKTGNNEEAARLLGIHRTTLIRKMQKYGICLKTY